MTKEDIIRMAREAGFADGVVDIVGFEGFANFAKLVAAHEREESVKKVEKLLDEVVNIVIKESAEHKLVKNLTSCFKEGITDAIRARGEK
jgi:hypothetical protein